MGKANAIERRHTKQCDICFLLDSTSPKDTKFFCYKEEWEAGEECGMVRKYVCEECVNGIKEIREKCMHKLNNPHHNVLDKFEPWFVRNFLKKQSENEGKKS